MKIPACPKKGLVLLFLFLTSLTNLSLAHEPDHSYLYLKIFKEGMAGRIEMTAKDMNRALNLNLPDALSLEMIDPHLNSIYDYLKKNVAFSSVGENYGLKFTEPSVLELEEMEDFIRFEFETDKFTKEPEVLDIKYDVLFDQYPRHKGILIVEQNWKAGIVNNQTMISSIFEQGNTRDQLSLEDSSIWKGVVALIKLGMWHIWIGLDHILFIVALILPAVVRRKEENDAVADYSSVWKPVEKFRPAFLYILKIITFFTIAHSITLALAALEIVNLNSRFVESTIAISIALAAYHNIRPILKGKEWVIAFGFGLFHGFGFASVLGEKGLSGDYMTLSLFGFNVGVEIGQVLIICGIFPILYLIRKHKLYPALIKYGSMVLIFISLYWFIERGFDVDLPLGAYFWKINNAIFG